MNFRLTIVINRPAPHVYDQLKDPGKIQRLLPDNYRLEPLAGTPGTPGATSRVTIGAGPTPLTVVETIVEQHPHDLLASTYEVDGAVYSLMHTFESLPGAGTRWTCECTSQTDKGGWLANWIFSKVLHSAGTKAMARVKVQLETQASVR